jgi:hypothetical protein
MTEQMKTLFDVQQTQVALMEEIKDLLNKQKGIT